MSKAKFLVLFLLAAQLCFSAWTQKLNISAADLTGKPVEKAQINIIYQKASQVSESDGLLSGETNAEGMFSAEISNRVQASESKTIQVRISTPYWAGETRKVQAGDFAAQQIRFTVPFRLSDVYVKVLSSRQAAVPGASVVISGKVPLRKATGADGRARFFFPSDFNFTGFVSFSNVSKRFTSQEIKSAEGRSTITVTLPPLEGEAMGSVVGEGRNGIAIAFVAMNGSAVEGSKVTFLFMGRNYSAYTDSNGVVGFLSDSAGPLNATIRQYEYDYAFPLNLTAGNSTAELELYHLLKVVSFTSLQDGDNCFRLTANVTDPRSSVPLRVRMFWYVNPKNMTALQANQTPSGLYAASTCIRSDSSVRLSAANRYDSAEATLNLTFTRPKGPAAAKPFNQTSLQPEKPKETDDMVVVAIVLLAACLLGAFFGRAYLSKSSRFMIEYVRRMSEDMEKRRHKMGVPPVRPLHPPGQQPPEEPPSEEQPPKA